MSKVHIHRTRVRYAETDAMGVMHHGNWPVLWELGRTNLLRARYRSYAEIEREGVLFPVVDYGVTILSPARYDDEIEIRSQLAELGRVNLRFEHEGWCGSKLLARGPSVHGVIDPDWKVIRLPAELAAALLED